MKMLFGSEDFLFETGSAQTPEDRSQRLFPDRHKLIKEV